MTWEELTPGLKQSIELDLISGIIMYFILVVVVAFSIVNTFFMAIFERKKEFGVLMSIGMKPGRLVRLMLLEALSMTWVGLVLGAEWLDILPNIGDTNSWWPWVFVGIGPWALGMNLYRSFTDLPNPNTWDWVWTAIFMVTAIGAFVDFSGEIAGATALVIIGGLIIFNAIRKQ